MSPDESYVCSATGVGTVEGAISWLAEGLPVADTVDWGRILRTLVSRAGNPGDIDQAVRRATREATTSSLDSSKLLFDPESVPTVEEVGGALRGLRTACGPDGLAAICARSVHAAYLSDPLVLDVLCLVAGTTLKEAASDIECKETVWSEATIEELMTHLALAFNVAASVPLLNAETVRPVELRRRSSIDWSDIEQLARDGVPYEALLTQRLVGSAWGAYRNRTSSMMNAAVVRSLCERLNQRAVQYRVSAAVGGETASEGVQELLGIADKRVAMAILREGRPHYGLVISSARDGGTARANGDGLLQIPSGDVPLVLILVGLGWSGRHETDRLAQRFGGRLFTDGTLDSLVDFVSSAND